jgi:hypothetical protein
LVSFFSRQKLDQSSTMNTYINQFRMSHFRHPPFPLLMGIPPENRCK